ncbi:hypothetical protein [Chryseobacterium tongliaoense]|uniref:hypothetical protein n=1 Tax=Chryseobacterium tongliaoense TaxID=3240933 RepID=UPI0035153A83
MTEKVHPSTDSTIYKNPTIQNNSQDNRMDCFLRAVKIFDVWFGKKSSIKHN